MGIDLGRLALTAFSSRDSTSKPAAMPSMQWPGGGEQEDQDQIVVVVVGGVPKITSRLKLVRICVRGTLG